MKKIIIITICLLLAAVGGYFAMHSMHHGSHHAHEFKAQAEAGDLTIGNVTGRFLLADRPGAVFLTIQNKGEADRLLSASSAIAARVELHTHKNEDGVIKMRPIETIEVGANGMTELKSGGLHIMLFDITKLPEKGSKVPVTLTFEKAGTVEVEATVGEPGEDHSSH